MALDAEGLAAMAFSVYRATGQGTNSGARKVQLNTEEFDVSGVFDAATNNRFQPTIKGIYLITAGVGVGPGPGAWDANISKNGAALRFLAVSSGGETLATGSTLVAMNGTTDYLELWCNTTNSVMILGASTQTFMQGHLVGRTS